MAQDTSLAYRCHAEDGRIAARLEPVARPGQADLAAGEVLLRAAWSGLNYKDALAVTGAGKIMRRLPLTAGIDVAGVVEASADARFRAGDAAIVVGCGLGEEFDGGLADHVRVRGDWIVRLPAGLSLQDAMIIGTAGFTAGLAVTRMEDNGLAPGGGPVAVTGATGGVGSLAIALLARRGYRVTALTGKPDAADYLQSLGAASILPAADVPASSRPLETAQWAGAIDNLGGPTLAWLIATTEPRGSVASVGLAATHTLATTVMPFILRGVNLLGINSTYCPAALRDRVWAELARHLGTPSPLLETIVHRTVGLADLPGAFAGYTTRPTTGRTLVRISGALGRA